MMDGLLTWADRDMSIIYLTQQMEYLCVIKIGCDFFLNSVGGLILDKTVSNPNFAGMAVFTPVINGETPYHLVSHDAVFPSVVFTSPH